MPPVRAALFATLFYAAVTLALTYPLIDDLAGVVPSDLGDPLLSTFLLWWNAQSVPLTAQWWNVPAFFPSPDTLALSEHFLGLSFLTSPIIWATGHPQVAYNIAFLLTFILSALGGHALGFVLTGRHDAALIAGLAYACAPYRMGQFSHIHVLASFWMPMALAALHLFVRDGRWRWLAIFALTTMLQGLTSGQYLLFFPVLVGLWVLWFVIVQRRFHSVAVIGAAFAVACLPAVPILLRYADVHQTFGFYRGIDEVIQYSADITALIRGEPNLRFWGRTLLEAAPEGQLFPGLTIVVLIVVGMMVARPARLATGNDVAADPWRWLRRALLILAVIASLIAIALPILGAWQAELFGATLSVRRISRPISVGLVLWCLFLVQSRRAREIVRSQSAFAFYVAATVVMWVLAFGPHPTFNGERVVYWAPYRWLMVVPGFSSVRVPARFAMLAALCLAAAASIAVARILARTPTRLRPVLAALVSLCIVADGWTRAMPLARPPAPSLLTAATSPGAVLELPIGEVDVATMYRAMTHRHPVANGYSGYFPPVYQVLRSGVESFDPHALIGLAGLGVRHVVVFQSDAARKDEWNTWVRGVPGISLVSSSDGQTQYALAPTAPPASPPRAGARLPIAWVTTDLHPEILHRLLDDNVRTCWESGRAQSGTVDERLVAALDGVRRIAGVTMALGEFRTAYPREIQVERSLDCVTWEPVWRGPTASLALSAALADPVTVPLSIQFEPADARCIAIRQSGSTAREHWAVAELSVLGANDSR